MTIIGETANVASNVGNLFRVRQQSSCGGYPPWVAHPPIRLTLLALGFDSTDFFSQLPCVRAHRQCFARFRAKIPLLFLLFLNGSIQRLRV
jgi:hypothetical protein